MGTGMTPYEVIYDKPLPPLSNYLQGSSRNDAVDAELSTREEIHTALRRKLLKAQEAMKHFADQKRRDVAYEVDQLVYVKLRPHRQSSLRHQPLTKLAKHYFGPFRVLEHIGNVAYRLQLPEGSKIHSVFHCSLLRPHHGPLDLHHTPLPPDARDHHPLLEPIAILDSGFDPSTQPPTRMVLVQWMGLAPEDSTWEKWTDVCNAHHLEHKVVFPGADDVSSSNMNEAPPPATHEPRPRRSVTRPRHLEEYV